MNAAKKRLIKAGNGLAVFLYRRSSGRIGGTARGKTPVLLLPVPGRKSGIPYTTLVSYFENQGGYVVTGAAGGTKHDPSGSGTCAPLPEHTSMWEHPFRGVDQFFAPTLLRHQHRRD